MLLDAQNLFSENQEVLTGSAYSQNVVKFGKNDISFVPIIIQVVEDFAGLTSLKVGIETSETENFSTSSTLIESTLVLDDLTQGNKFPISYLPKGNKGYIRLKYTVTGTGTKGKITAGVVAADELSWHNQ